MLLNSRRRVFSVVALVLSVGMVGALAASVVTVSAFHRSDFSLFTTQGGDFVECTSSKPALIFISATNRFGETDNLISVRFGSGTGVGFVETDSVDYIVPAGQSISLAAAFGHNVDDRTIRVDPLDNDGLAADPIVGWVSIQFHGGSASCATIPL